MSAIRRCPEHGSFDVNTCPVCGTTGALALGGDRRTRLSKFASGALRHFPDDAGLSLDERGWVAYETLVETVCARYSWAEPEHVDAVVATDPKERFEREGRRVRAAYGHSIDVDLRADDGEHSGERGATIPDRLYHGTAPRNREAILREGLRPMERQEIHLSATPADARDVGRRHAADPIVLVVDARGLCADGRRITERGRGVYTADRVPPAYLAEYDRRPENG